MINATDVTAPLGMSSLMVRRSALAQSRPPFMLAMISVFVALVAISPVLYTLMQALEANRGDAVAIVFRPLVAKLLANTIGLIVAASFASTIVGAGTAWLVVRTDLPGRSIFGLLAAAPMAIPPFIASYAWVSLSNGLQDFMGAVLVVTCVYFPLVYLPVAAALRGLDPALEETALVCGLSPWRCFMRVTLPQLAPALYGGMLLVALDTLVEFGAFQLLRFRTFTTVLYAQYRTGFDGPETSLLATILLGICLILVVGEIYLRGKVRYARVGSGTRRLVKPIALGWFKWPAFAGFIALIAATLGVPVSMVLYWLLQHSTAATSAAQPSLQAIISATFSSLSYGLSGAGAALIMSAPLAYLNVRYPGPFASLMERAAYLAMGTPGIVVALAFVSISVQFLRPLYQSSMLLVAAYGILFLPLALVGVRSALSQVPPRLEDTARALGSGWTSVTFRILAPLAGPGIGASAAMVFSFISSELTATLLLAPIGTRTLATEIWANTSALAFAAAAPFAAVMLMISLGSVWLFARRFGAAALPEEE